MNDWNLNEKSVRDTSRTNQGLKPCNYEVPWFSSKGHTMSYHEFNWYGLLEFTNLPINKQNGEWGHPLKDGLPPWCSLHKELMMIRWLSQLYNECIITNVTDNPNTTCLWMNFTSLRCFALCGVLPLISPRLKEFIKGLLPPPQKKIGKVQIWQEEITSRKYGKKELQLFSHCGSFDHPDLQSLNDFIFVF